MDEQKMTNDRPFREMRRKRQLLTEAESIDILKNATSGVLALMSDDDYPYAVPLSYLYADGRLYFHSALTGHKVDAIRKHPKASFCVVAQDEIHSERFTTFYRSVIAFGRVHVIDDENEKVTTAKLFGQRYNPHDKQGLTQELKDGLPRMLIIRFDIEHLTGKEAIELVKQKNQT